MNITETQLYWLQRIRKDGPARVHGLQAIIGGEKTKSATQVSLLHLAAHGALRGQNGELHITAYGLRICGQNPPPDFDDPILTSARLQARVTELENQLAGGVPVDEPVT